MRKPPNTTGQYGDESIIVSNAHGFQVRVPAAPADVDYVRVVRVDGASREWEYFYWNQDEWKEGPDAMGALMGAIKAVAEGQKPLY